MPLSALTLWLDTSPSLPWLTDSGLLFRFSTESARQILSVIIGSLITVTSLVFSMTVVALSITASQLGPRLIQMFSRGTLPQIVLGSLIGNIIFSLLLLQAIGDPVTGVETAPALSLSTSILGIIFSLGLLVYFLHHTARKMDADAVVGAMGENYGASIAAATADNATKSPMADFKTARAALSQNNDATKIVIPVMETGYIQAIDTDALTRLATKHGICIDIDAKPGRFTIKGTVLGTVYADTEIDPTIPKQINANIATGTQRTHAQDLEFSISALVEIALRAMSPGINDPYTAITCIDRLASGLAATLETGLPRATFADEQGRPRLVISPVTYTGLFNTSFNEIRQGCRDKIAVIIRLLEVLDDLLQLAQSEEQRAAVSQHANSVIRLAADVECDESDGQALRERIDRLRSRLAD